MLETLKHEGLKAWIHEVVEWTKPARVHICDGSEKEYTMLAKELERSETFTRLNPDLRPNSFLARSDPKDVARVENRTFICSEKEEDAGPTNHWEAPEKMRAKLWELYKGCMQGRVLYVIPFSMGPIGSSIGQIGVELSDSAYVACNMRIMTRMGQEVLDVLGEKGSFIPCLHSVGVPLKVGERSAPWPCNPENTHIVHFPKSRTIWSFGSGYGGNALLGKKCFALRIASIMGKEEGWMAEHMLIVGITNPKGVKKYMAAAFPSACGKTNLAMLQSSLPGWKVECVGDDIAWMNFHEDGRLYAVNPEAGFFGVAPGTSEKVNPNALKACAKNSVFTNVALNEQGDIWWEGLTEEKPAHLTDWLGNPWTPASSEKAAHPNSRFTAPAHQCPVMDPAWEDPRGVPISAIIFGGRRSSVVPLVFESFDWNHGTYMGCSVSSETTAAAAGAIGKLRHDPFAMLPFCGYHMGDYFAHWVKMGKKTKPDLLPKIFTVNWFQKNAKGEFLWPGFGENIRVIEWMFERIEGDENYEKTPIGLVPKKNALNVEGLSLEKDALDQLLAVDRAAWKEEVEEMKRYLVIFGDRFPKELQEQLAQLEERLNH